MEIFFLSYINELCIYSPLCLSSHGHHQMVNMEIRLIIFFAAKDGESLYSQQNQEWELIVAHIMNSLLPNSDLH